MRRDSPGDRMFVWLCPLSGHGCPRCRSADHHAGDPGHVSGAGLPDCSREHRSGGRQPHPPGGGRSRRTSTAAARFNWTARKPRPWRSSSFATCRAVSIRSPVCWSAAAASARPLVSSLASSRRWDAKKRPGRSGGPGGQGHLPDLIALPDPPGLTRLPTYPTHRLTRLTRPIRLTRPTRLTRLPDLPGLIRS